MCLLVCSFQPSALIPPYGWSAGLPSVFVPPYGFDWSQQSPSVQPLSNSGNPFRICFVAGNMCVCYECKGKYLKEAGLPHDLCFQHEELRWFTPSGSTTPQSHFSNVYYHCNAACIFATFPSFVPSSVIVPPQVHAKLDSVHKQWIYSQFVFFVP